MKKSYFLTLSLVLALQAFSSPVQASLDSMSPAQQRQHLQQLKKRDREMQQSFEKALRQILPQFLEDQHYLAKIKYFQPAGREHDLASYLDSLKVQPQQPLALPEAVLSLPFEEQIKQARSLDYQAFDFGWMKRLKDYDHLNLSQLKANQAQLQNNPYLLPTMVDYPDFLTLKLWARFRILRGVAHAEVVEAVQEARQLAYLLLNSDSLPGAMTGLSILEEERQIYEYWMSRLSNWDPSWEPFAQNTLTRLRRTLPATPAFYMAGQTPMAVFRQIRKDPAVQVGTCVGMAEAATGLSALSLMSGPQQTQGLKVAQEMAQQVRKSKCRFSQIEKVWNQPLKASEAFFQAEMDTETRNMLGKEPLKREIMFYTLANLARPNFLRDYLK